MAATTKSNVEMVESLYDAFNSGDLDTVIDAMDDDITWVEPDGDALARGTHRGPAAVMSNVFAPIEEAYEEFEVLPKRFIDAGDIVVAEGLMNGRTTVGHAFEIPFAHVCEMHNGKLRKFTNYADTALWQRAFEA